MRVFVTGGTGFVGETLTNAFARQGHLVTILTRDSKKRHPWGERAVFLKGDPTKRGGWQDEVPGQDVIINLAGSSIFKRWTADTKRAIRDSRVLTTKNLVEALRHCKGKKPLFLSTSAVGYYGFRGDEELGEGSGPGNDFLASVTQEWESAALEAEDLGVRVVLCRFGIVLGRRGGAFARILPLFKWGLGSPLGSGEQWFSWIHEKDLARICLFLIDRPRVSGPVNCTAPEPITNRDMTIVLGEVLNRPTFFPAIPGFVIKAVMGEFGSLILKGQKALPKRLMEMGFGFEFPSFRGAIEDVVGR